jgi:hypothetical protein
MGEQTDGMSEKEKNQLRNPFKDEKKDEIKNL